MPFPFLPAGAILAVSVPSGPTPPDTTGSPDASPDPARTTQPPQGGIEIIDLEG